MLPSTALWSFSPNRNTCQLLTQEDRAVGALAYVGRIYHLDRGFDRLEEKLSRVGADIARVPE